MYYMYLDTMQIPVPPSSMSTKISSRNKTIDLLGAGEVNIIKDPGLTEISFKFLLPNNSYPFDQSLLRFGSSHASTYLDTLESFKTGSAPFQFIVVRMKDSGALLNMTNLTVTLEDYTVEEDADYGYDMYADVTLKKYVSWGAKALSVETDKDGNQKATVDAPRSTAGHVIPTQVKAPQGATMQQVLKRALGSATDIFAIAKLNKIAIPAILSAGQVIKLGNQRGTVGNTSLPGSVIMY